MEYYDAFTLRHRGMQLWLLGLIVVSGAIASLASPAFWMAILGMLLATSGLLANSARTGQWYTWQRWDPSISWYEGWAILSGGIFAAAPFVEILVRARLGF